MTDKIASITNRGKKERGFHIQQEERIDLKGMINIDVEGKVNTD